MKQLEYIVGLVLALGAICHIVIWLKTLLKGRSKVVGVVRSQRDYVFGTIYSLLCAVFWSLSYVSLSYVSTSASLLDINVVLLGSASAFLLLAWGFSYFLSRKTGESLRLNVNWKTLAPWVVVGANLASFLLFVYALSFISASQTIILQKINPLIVLLISLVWLRRKPAGSTWSAVVLVILGTTLIVANDQFTFTGSRNLIGSLFAILAGAAFAFFSVGLEKIEETKTNLTQRLGFMATVFLLSYMGILTIGYMRSQILSFNLLVIGILLLNGLRVAIVYVFYHEAVRRIGALLASVIVALEVPFTIFFDWQLLQQIPGRRLAIGAAAVLLGAITLVWDRISRSSPRTSSNGVP